MHGCGDASYTHVQCSAVRSSVAPCAVRTWVKGAVCATKFYPSDPTSTFIKFPYKPHKSETRRNSYIYREV